MSEQMRFRTWALQRLACVNANGQARLILTFDNHIRRLGNTVLRASRDIRLPTIPEAPVGSHRRAATITVTQPVTNSFPNERCF